VIEIQESNAQLYSQLLDIRVRNINNTNKNVSLSNKKVHEKTGLSSGANINPLGQCANRLHY